MYIALCNDNGFNASLHLNSQRLRRFTPLAPARIAITNHDSGERRRVEAFIEHVFWQSYGARITRHYPMLLSVHDEQDNVLAALGFRYADKESLFLEHYLDNPIEHALGDFYGTQTLRSGVVEIGNLASNAQGASIFMFTAINVYLMQQGKHINVVTATESLRRYFKALGFDLRDLGNADPQRLQGGGASWGSYYDEDPRIIAAPVQQVISRLERHLHVALNDAESDMLAKLHLDCIRLS